MDKKRPEFNSVDKALCTFLDEKNKAYQANDKSKTGQTYWHASGLGYCLRKQYFIRLGLQRTHSTPYQYRFVAMDGNSSHEWRQKALDDLGILLAAEKTLINKKYQYKGRYDALVTLSSGLSLIDIKTQGTRAWIRRKYIEKTGVCKEHKIQLASYFLFLKKKYPKLNDARLYYYNRDTGEREEFQIHFSDSYLQKVLQILITLNTYWKNKEVPPPPAPDERKLCKYCEFRGRCKDLSGHGEVDIKIKNNEGKNK